MTIFLILLAARRCSKPDTCEEARGGVHALIEDKGTWILYTSKQRSLRLAGSDGT